MTGELRYQGGAHGWIGGGGIGGTDKISCGAGGSEDAGAETDAPTIEPVVGAAAAPR